MLGLAKGSMPQFGGFLESWIYSEQVVDCSRWLSCLVSGWYWYAGMQLDAMLSNSGRGAGRANLISSEVRAGPDTNSILSSRQLAVAALIPGIRAHGLSNLIARRPVTRPKLNDRLSTGALVQDLPGLL